MGRKVLVVVLCWLALSEALGETEKKVYSSVIKDNESAESAPKLYQKVNSGVYASGIPHGAYSLRLPFVIQPASSQLQQTSVVVPHATLLNSLKDSYGKFTESPHAAPYRSTFPQQFVQLQGLPPHLAQPLVSTASSNGVHYKTIPFILGSDNHKVTEFSASPTPLAHFASHSQPLVYAENVKSFVPNGPSHLFKFSSTPHHISPHYISTVAQSPSEFSGHHLSSGKTSEFSGTSPYRTSSQQSSSKSPSKFSSTSHHKIPYHTSSQLNSNKTPTEFYNTYPPQASSHKLPPQHSSSTSHQYIPNGQQYSATGHILSAPAHQPHQTPQSQVASSSSKVINHEIEQKASPAQTSVTTYVNGKKTVINIETKPPLPLLDLNLLEPLTFDNPLVPQVQHFLPKIETATYHKLPQFNVKNPKNNQKEFVITKTKSYDSGFIKEKPHKDVAKNRQNKPRPQNKPTKPSVAIHGDPNGEEFSYEINTPNHKETYNEKVLKYNKKTDTKPVEYSYNEHTRKEPEVYSFVHSSKEPLKVTHVEYDSDNDSPKHVNQQVSSENQSDIKENNNRPSSQEDEEQSEDVSEDSSSESEDDGPPPHAYQEEPSRYSNTEHDEPLENTRHNEYKGHVKSNKDEHVRILPSTPQPFQHYSYHSSSSKSPPTQHHPENHHQLNEHIHHQELPKFHPQGKVYEANIRHSQSDGELKHHHSTSTPSHLLKAEHREQQRPNHEIKTEVITGSPKYYSEPLIIHTESFQPITPEYEEDIRLLPTHKPHSEPIKVDPNQHVQLGPVRPQTDKNFAYPSPTPQKLPQQQTHSQPPTGRTQPDHSPEPHIYEKSKRIIIKEQEETPDEMHKHMEQVMTQILDREENGEDDFEKAYKESAYGFPAYEKSAEDIEKDIYDPDSYGSPRFHYEYNGDDPTFQQYVKEGDKYPKSARSAYKDARDNNQEEYYLDFSVNQPESFLDRHKSKVDYYKMYKKNRPEKIFSHVNDDEENNKEKKSEKFVVAPSFDFGFGSSPTQKPKQSNLFARYTTAPLKFGYDYSKIAPRDSSAYASRLFHKFKRPGFTQPQFHYGFAPISAPLVVDSELAAMASNVSPESEKAGMRKKVYKENWYIKKTSTTGSKPS